MRASFVVSLAGSLALSLVTVGCGGTSDSPGNGGGGGSSNAGGGGSSNAGGGGSSNAGGGGSSNAGGGGSAGGGGIANGGGGGSAGGGGNGGGGGTPVTPSGFWSPSYFMPLDDSPQSLPDVIAATGEKSFLLAFVLDSGNCTPAWDGLAANPVATDTTVAAVIASARAAGADVGISFGGYNGTELGQSCGSASALAAAYQAVIDKYKLTHIDLDVENAALGDTANETKRFQAVKLLEDAATAAGRTLNVSLTIPMTTVGFPDTGRAQISLAIAAGARIDIFNIMDFDYGGPAATMTDSDIAVAEDVHAQLKALYPSWTDAQAYAHTGLQLMNGHTDQPSELFTTDTFKGLLAYAQAKHLGWLANWALNRDRACDPSVPHNWADGACSSVDQQPYDFTKILAQYGG